MRLALIRLELSEEQREDLATRTGKKPTEALVVGMVETDETLENELTGEADRRLAEEIWRANQRFVDKMQQAGDTLDAYQSYMGHPLETHVPNVVVFR